VDVWVGIGQNMSGIIALVRKDPFGPVIIPTSMNGFRLLPQNNSVVVPLQRKSEDVNWQLLRRPGKRRLSILRETLGATMLSRAAPDVGDAAPINRRCLVRANLVHTSR
jgi:hypothetical protein